MRTFQTFLERPHNLKSTTIKSYKVAVLRWQKAAQKSFEETYLNEATVNKTLKFLEEKMEPSTWNTSLQRYKRLAKYLYDEKDEAYFNSMKRRINQHSAPLLLFASNHTHSTEI